MFSTHQTDSAVRPPIWRPLPLCRQSERSRIRTGIVRTSNFAPTLRTGTRKRREERQASKTQGGHRLGNQIRSMSSTSPRQDLRTQVERFDPGTYWTGLDDS